MFPADITRRTYSTTTLPSGRQIHAPDAVWINYFSQHISIDDSINRKQSLTEYNQKTIIENNQKTLDYREISMNKIYFRIRKDLEKNVSYEQTHVQELA